MLRLSKKTDYGLLALRHLGAAGDGDAPSSAREIAAAYGIPEPVLAKILQQLKGAGLVRSRKGKSGGYVLAQQPESISVMQVLRAIEGPVSLVSCNFREDSECDVFARCGIKDPLAGLNEKVMELLAATTLDEICE
ncbi:MAG: RrF2 family transcriptional regulator [Myxococcota bacterium]